MQPEFLQESATQVVIPLWIPAFVLAALAIAVIWLVTRWRGRRR